MDMLSLNKDFSLYDLRLIGDLATHILSYDELITLYRNLPTFDPYHYGEDTVIYRTQIHKILNNICDICINENNIELATEILNKHKNFAKVHTDLRYLFYIRINEIMINYLKDNDKKELDKLLEISESFKLAGDINTANAVKYQYNSHKNKETYELKKAVSFDSL
ncbi:hypothetical protein [Enterococcus rivorum]|uniref:Transcriptional regulator n=1 Tax=Enterococcus rivorum TaxID=762845 RepID=A0A1E5L0H5_9ENTE|nr:hypothetical protein [Enterococcus rivorum]MBP2098891.1 uncharacterized lipoprotein YehR (DUF1307 family) [Enterococcus rivorum]OEH83616.1 hypothetical protein BCR26_09065 [Enterococcus rivorum]